MQTENGVFDDCGAMLKGVGASAGLGGMLIHFGSLKFGLIEFSGYDPQVLGVHHFKVHHFNVKECLALK